MLNIEFVDELTIDNIRKEAYFNESSRTLYLDSELSFRRRTEILSELRAEELCSRDQPLPVLIPIVGRVV